MRMGKATFYRTEVIEFKEQYDKRLSWDECVIVHQKLRRHYKLLTGYGFYTTELRYNSRIYGRAHGSGLIELGRHHNIGILCHEISHLVAYKKYKSMKHSKRLYRIMSRVMNFARKKSYWSEELSRRVKIVQIP